MQQIALLLILGTMVFAVSLQLKLADFRYVARHRLAVAVGLVVQFGLLPLATLALTLVLPLPAPVEAAMLLVASCPGGAMSNVITHFGRGNLALSLSISAVSNLLALVLTPLIFTAMVAANPATTEWMRVIKVAPQEVLISLVLLLAVPMGLALSLSRWAPQWGRKLQKPLEAAAVLALVVLITLAVAAQWPVFVRELTRTLPLVVLHNALGLSLGWISSSLMQLAVADRRAVTVEGGMQNAGLALGIIATQFGGDIAMVAVAGLWGVWHLISGASLALLWRQ